MTDKQILDRLNKGLIEVNLETLAVKDFNNSTRSFYIKTPDFHQKTNRCFHHFHRRRDGKRIRRAICRNRLVWMAVHRRVVPDGFVVDHIDGNCCNDLPGNLQLMTREESDRQGHLIRDLDVALDKARAFFDHIEWYGVEPTEEFCGIEGALCMKQR